ncbi:hypothetical protein ACU5EH_06200 [Aliivibrio salmonicida]|uniref:hypothetical protein n=1 Tax=Aliivibrio salmonicida TaxID=40269 RepID=UPI00406D37D3
MSLIFAKRDESGNVCIVSDTKLNYEIDRKLPSYSSYQKNGGLKLFVVNHGKVAISFAGCSAEAQDTFDRIDLDNWNLSNALEILKESSAFGTTDYLLCNAVNNVIYKISDGVVAQPDYAYIGDFDGYQVLTKNIKQSSGLHDLDIAMNKVISDSNVKTVGGFCIAALSDNGLFRYTSKHSFSQFKGHIKLSNVPTTIPILLNPVNDTYSYGWTGSQYGFALYFYEAKLGLIYLPLKINPVEVCSEVNLDFFDQILMKYNLKMPLRIDTKSEEEKLIDFSYELYLHLQYQRCIDKISLLENSSIPKVFFQSNYLLGCCYKELGIKTESENITIAIEYLKKSIEYFDKLSLDYQPDFSVLTNKGTAFNYLGYMTDNLEEKKIYFNNAVSNYAVALTLDDQNALPYQNRAAANYELLRYCKNQAGFSKLITLIIEDCDKALLLDNSIQIAANLRMHVQSIRA